MDVDFDGAGGRYGGGGKRVYSRDGSSANSLGGGGGNRRVCYHWLAGRCDRHPCPYLHSELPESGPNGKRGHNPGNSSQRWGSGPSGSGRASRNAVDQLCRFFLSGKCTYGENCRFIHAWCVGDGLKLLTPLQGHQKVVTGIALPSGSDKLFSGSKDESVRMWDCSTGQCSGVVSLGREVGCMISIGSWLFIGIVDAVKVWNMQIKSDLSLAGPTGQVYALAVGNEMLFAGTQDGQILVWKFIVAVNSFEPAAALVGHRVAVVSLAVGGTRLYSGSMDNTIRVWDLITLQCIQVLQDHTDVVLSILLWDQFFLSSSLDSTIKVWVTTASGSMEVIYTHKEEHGILALCGMQDAKGKPILLCSLKDMTVHIYDLPSFSERGRIFSKEEVRVIQYGPGGLFFTGDRMGELKVWNWLADGVSTS